MRKRRTASRDSLALWAVNLALATSVGLTGCGDGRIPTYPVSGMVVVDGRPAEGAVVIFCPLETSPEVEKLRPAAKADPTGRFELMTFEPEDGAPAGNYKVLVKWPMPVPASQQRDGRPGVATGPDRLKGKYYNLETTPLTATIEEQANELSAFELKSG